MRRLPLVATLLFALTVTVRAADVEKGKTIFEKCAACHSLEAGKNDDAPNLNGIFGRKVASIDDYRYSAAMKRSDVVWSESTLNSFLEDPQGFIPGNRMPFDGLKEKSDREDLLAYLKVATRVASLRPTSGDTVLSDGSSSHDEFNLDLDGKETALADATISSKRVDGNTFDIIVKFSPVVRPSESTSTTKRYTGL